jgi:membrane-associated phospholipid phosphatase
MSVGAMAVAIVTIRVIGSVGSAVRFIEGTMCRMRARFLVAWIFVLFLPAGSEAGNVPSGPGATPEPGRARSAYRLEPWRDGFLIGTAAAGAGTAAIITHSREALTEADIERLSRSSINRFDRGATLEFNDAVSNASWVLAAAVVAAPFSLLLETNARHDWRELSFMYAETMALAVVLPSVAKSSTGKIRPLVYNPDISLERKFALDPRGSFFSRHTTVAFASAVFLCTVYDRYNPDSRAKVYLWTGSIAAAAGVGYMRYESGRHFPTDIIVGAAVGSALGWGIPALHRSGGGRFAVAPLVDGRRVGLALRLDM